MDTSKPVHDLSLLGTLSRAECGTEIREAEQGWGYCRSGQPEWRDLAHATGVQLKNPQNPCFLGVRSMLKNKTYSRSVVTKPETKHPQDPRGDIDWVILRCWEVRHYTHLPLKKHKTKASKV